MITEHKEYRDNGQLYEHHFRKDGKHHGEYKWWWSDGTLGTHCFYKDGELHGEYKWWCSNNGQLYEHRFMKDNKNITTEVKLLVTDILNITNEERMIIKLHHGVKCL